MNPIQKLMEEHRRIVEVLERFGQFAGEIRAKGSFDRDKLALYVRFVKEYADKYHHAKEEDILFAMMGEHGFSQKSGPIAVMLHEHDQGRQIIRFLKEVTREPNPLTAEEIQAVANAIYSYTDLLRHHIMKEDNILYPMASSNLPASAMIEMAARFEKVEADRTESGQIAKLEELAAKLNQAA